VATDRVADLFVEVRDPVGFREARRSESPRREASFRGLLDEEDQFQKNCLPSSSPHQDSTPPGVAQTLREVLRKKQKVQVSLTIAEVSAAAPRRVSGQQKG